MAYSACSPKMLLYAVVLYNRTSYWMLLGPHAYNKAWCLLPLGPVLP
jgi:hypothetical protein